MAERSDDNRAVCGVSRLVLGTAAIGLAYGLPPPGHVAPVLMSDETAHALVHAAEAAGVHAFDTAPAYGVAEPRLGAALSSHARVWSKVSVRAERSAPEVALESLTESLAVLRRPQIELLSWHNWTRALGDDGAFQACWRALAGDPRVSALGATTYGRDDALAAVVSGLFRVVQVEWNLLNQGVVAEIAQAARARGVSVAARSVFLQGVLTDRGDLLPSHIDGLREPRAKAQSLAQSWNMSLSTLALRAALDHPDIDWVLVGLDGTSQLEQALDAASMPPLTAEQRAALVALDLAGAALTDPRTWRAP